MLLDELPMDMREEAQYVKKYLSMNPVYGNNNVLKDYLAATSTDLYVKRGLNAVQRKGSVIYASLIPNTLLEDLQRSKLKVCIYIVVISLCNWQTLNVWLICLFST